MNRPIRVLITGGGGAGTLEILRTLKATGRYYLVAVDASPYAMGLRWADAGYVVPMATDPRYEEVVASIMARERPDYLIPLVDEEIAPIHRLGAVHRIPVIAPSLEFCQLCLDKWRLMQALDAAGISVPETWLASQRSSICYPAVLKPRRGRGSRGLRFLANAQEHDQALISLNNGVAEDYVIQRRVEGREFTVSVVVGLSGAVLAVVPKEALVKRGITQVGVTRVIPSIDRLARQIQDRLQANGPFNIQLILRPDETPVIFEINPRYSTTVALTIASGIHEVDLVIRHARGEPIGPLSFQPDLLMVRSVSHVYMPEAQWRSAPTVPSGEPVVR